MVNWKKVLHQYLAIGFFPFVISINYNFYSAYFLWFISPLRPLQWNEVSKNIILKLQFFFRNKKIEFLELVIELYRRITILKGMWSIRRKLHLIVSRKTDELYGFSEKGLLNEIVWAQKQWIEVFFFSSLNSAYRIIFLYSCNVRVNDGGNPQ